MMISLCSAMTSITAIATEVEFKEAQIMLQGEDLQSFVLKDINGDHRLDVIYSVQVAR